MRQWASTFTEWFERYTFFIIPASLILGFIASDAPQPFISWAPYLFGYVTMVMALGCGITHLKKVAARPWPLALVLILSHAVAPLIAYGLGVVLFGAESDYTIGLVLFTVIPLGVSSVLWVGISGGNVPFMLAMVVLDSALSPIVVPGLIEIFFGTQIAFDSIALMKDLLIIVVVPTVIGVILYELSKGKIKVWSAPVTQPISKLAFMMVVTLNAAAIAPSLQTLRSDMVIIVPIVIALVAFHYILGFFGSDLLKQRSREMRVTFAYGVGMRNISLGMVLAMSYFSPKASVPVVLAIMIQQPMATLFQAWVKRRLPLSPSGLGQD